MLRLSNNFCRIHFFKTQAALKYSQLKNPTPLPKFGVLVPEIPEKGSTEYDEWAARYKTLAIRIAEAMKRNPQIQVKKP